MTDAPSIESAGEMGMIEALEEAPSYVERLRIVRERDALIRADERARVIHNYEMLLDDVARIGEALGVNVAARPESPKQVVEEIILAAKIASGTVTLADVPEAPISDEMMHRAQEVIHRALATGRDEDES